MRWLLSVVFVAAASATAAATPPDVGVPSIVRVPFKGSPAKVDSVVKLVGSEFEMLTIQGYTGTVTWDATTPDASDLPVKIIELKPKETVIGLRVGVLTPDRYDAADTPSVAVFATGNGSVTLAVWGVKDGKPTKLAVFAVQANKAPQPPPQPPPVPDPPTPPTPPVGKTGAWVVVVVDEDHPTAAQAKISDGPTLRTFKAAGKCRVYGSKTDADVIATKKYDKLMQDAKVSSPALLVLDAEGHKVLTMPLPIDDAVLASKLKEVMQ